MSFHDKMLSRKGRPRTTLHPDAPPSKPSPANHVPSGPQPATSALAATSDGQKQPPRGPTTTAAADALPIIPPFTVKAIAERRQCSDGAVRRLIQDGELRSFRIGDLIRVAADEVARFECRR